MQQTMLMDVHEVREVVARLVRQEPISDDSVRTARDTFLNMCDEAAEFGLSPADVIRAVLRPAFIPARVCDCWGCKSRRGDLNQEEFLDTSLPVI